MKKILLILLLGVSMSVFGQIDVYDDIAAQETVGNAYNLIKEFYHENDICVSDSVYDLDWDFFDVDSEVKRSLDAYRVNKKFIWSEPEYSDVLNRIFRMDNCDHPQYIATFSEPYNHMIRCDVIPADLKIGIMGTPAITIFLFLYNEKGEVYQFFEGKLNVD